MSSMNPPRENHSTAFARLFLALCAIWRFIYNYFSLKSMPLSTFLLDSSLQPGLGPFERHQLPRSDRSRLAPKIIRFRAPVAFAPSAPTTFGCSAGFATPWPPPRSTTRYAEALFALFSHYFTPPLSLELSCSQLLADRRLYQTEYSKTDRSTCKGCKQVIKKDACRISRNTPSPFHDGFVAVWFHVPCLFKKYGGQLTALDQLGGYEELRIDDQVKISELIKSTLPAGFVPPVATSTVSENVAAAGAVDPENAAIALDNSKKLWALKDRIERDDISLKQMKALLELNQMSQVGGRNDLVSRVADAMLFGVAICPACAQREVVFSVGQYLCKHETSYGLCAYKGLSIESGGRVAIDLFKTDLNSETEWIRNWNQRPLAREKRLVTRQAIAEYNRDASQPLKSMKFTCIGQLEYDKETIQSLIVNNGGTYAQDIQSDIDYVITTYEDYVRATNALSSGAALPQETTILSASFSGSSLSSSASPSKDKSAKEISAEKKELLRKQRITTNEKLKQAMDMRLALVSEVLLDQLLITFGFDQNVYLINGNLPPIASARLVTPKTVFPDPKDANVPASGISLGSNADDNSGAAKPASTPAVAAAPAPKPISYGKVQTPSGSMTSRGVVDLEAKRPNGAVFKEVKPKAKVEKKEEKFDATSFESTKEKVEEKEDYELYDRMLSFTDITANLNKFYRLQLIDVNANGKSFTLFTRWGRVGEAGNWTTTPNGSLAEAKSAWEKKWKDKTKNDWKDRENFVKKAGAYSPMDIEEEEETKPKKKTYSDEPDAEEESRTEPREEEFTPSFLEPRLKSLIDLIFDSNMLARSMADLKIDIKKMPLGKINRNLVTKGYGVLKEIETVLLSTDDTQRFKLPSLSSQFYTYIPHDFGRTVPEAIDNFSILKLKMKQLETLLDIMIAAQMLDEAPPLIQSNPSDMNYKKLGVELIALNSYTREFKMIQRFVGTGYNPKTLGKTLTLHNVFKVDRSGEKDRFEAFRAMRPRKLLWHASRVCNFVGILNSGLRIAPPEAPASGYMFGKAIYLSDLIEKSAPYCVPDPETGIGLLVLCDTALGEPLPLSKPEYITALPEGKISAKALARFHPDPTKEETGDDKVLVPIGAPTPTNLPDVFLDHAEYMVYDPAQVRIRYLVQVQFSKDGKLVAPK